MPRFPGMDPFLESQLWEDFHTSYIAELRAAIVPLLPPGYVTVIERRVYLERSGAPTRVVRPDVTVATSAGQAPRMGGPPTLTAPVVVPLSMPQRLEEPYLTVRLAQDQEVVTVIEVLSPANKRSGGDGRHEYLSKRNAVLDSTAHIVEFDLLRAGTRLPMAQDLPPGDYYAVVSRAPRRPWAEVWPWKLPERMPAAPIPLAQGDPDCVIDLQEVFDQVYDRAGYAQSLNYRLPVEPPVEDVAWLEQLISA